MERNTRERGSKALGGTQNGRKGVFDPLAVRKEEERGFWLLRST